MADHDRYVRSQSLEVGIGLALLLFVLATAASAVVELVGKAAALRARDLEAAIVAMVRTPPGPGPEPEAPRADPVARLLALLNVGHARTHASYVSAKAFADAATQVLAELDDSAAAAAVAPLLQRADALARQARGNLTTVKVGLETWFDDRMNDVRTAYQRRAALVVLGVGFVLAALANASPVHVAQDLWHDATTREAVVAAAGTTAAPARPGVRPACGTGSGIERAACDVDRLSALSLPVGWGPEHRPDGTADYLAHAVGWLLTALLLMLGAPFWFALLTRLVGLRGARVPPASEDAGSHTALLRAEPTLGLVADNRFGRSELGPPEEDWLAWALNREPLPR